MKANFVVAVNMQAYEVVHDPNDRRCVKTTDVEQIAQFHNTDEVDLSNLTLLAHCRYIFDAVDSEDSDV